MKSILIGCLIAFPMIGILYGLLYIVYRDQSRPARIAVGFFSLILLGVSGFLAYLMFHGDSEWNLLMGIALLLGICGILGLWASLTWAKKGRTAPPPPEPPSPLEKEAPPIQSPGNPSPALSRIRLRPEEASPSKTDTQP